MLFSKSAPGLSQHLAYMHHELNPASEEHMFQDLDPDDIADEDGRYTLGAQRTPTHLDERKKFLWRPMQLGLSGVSGSGIQVHGMIWHHAARQVRRYEQIMRVCGDIFHPLIRDHAATCLADESYTDEIQSFIPYLSTTTVYFQLACRIPYLVQLQLMAKCLPKLDETMTKVVIRRMLNFVCNDRESRRFEDYKPLAQAVQEARSLKKRGDQAAEDCFWRTAISNYLLALTVILPWFPSEYYMAPWESRVNGIGGLLVKCNINLAIAISRCFQDSHTAYELLHHTSTLVCATNWEMGKMLHLQIKYAKELQTLLPRFSRSATKRLALNILPIPTLYARRDHFLARRRGALANRPWIGTFSPEDFRSHYLQLCRRVSLPTAGWWWSNEISQEATNVGMWEAHMGRAFVRHCEVWKKESRENEERDDLMASNAVRERREVMQGMVVEGRMHQKAGEEPLFGLFGMETGVNGWGPAYGEC